MEFNQIILEFEDSSDVDFAKNMKKFGIAHVRKALDLAYEILEIDNNASKWVARAAIRELESEKVQDKFLKS